MLPLISIYKIPCSSGSMVWSKCLAHLQTLSHLAPAIPLLHAHHLTVSYWTWNSWCGDDMCWWWHSLCPSHCCSIYCWCPRAGIDCLLPGKLLSSMPLLPSRVWRPIGTNPHEINNSYLSLSWYTPYAPAPGSHCSCREVWNPSYHTPILGTLTTLQYLCMHHSRYIASVA